MTTQTLTQTEKTQLEKINAYIEVLSTDPDIVETVKRIESGIKTTQGNYGRYLQFLTPFAKDTVTLYTISRALIKAGADEYGVSWACRLIKGEK
jgi:hypothetical protein